jgi:hypothetical protein
MIEPGRQRRYYKVPPIINPSSHEEDEMKRFLHWVGCLALVIVLIPAYTGHCAESLWVTSEYADLKAQRSISAETLAELERGAQLTLESYESRWYRVTTTDGLTGWVYRGKVSEAPPEPADSDRNPDEEGIGDLLGGLSGTSVKADAADSARSIRGLSPEAEAYAEKTGTPEQSRKALDRLLSMEISEAEVNAFLRAGTVGEFAE